MDTTLHWLTRPRPTGVTWGVPWPRGAVAGDAPFAVRAGDAAVPGQSWVTATWPDGSVKWSAHAAVTGAPSVRVVPGQAPATVDSPVWTRTDDDTITIHSGLVRWTVPRRGPVLIRSAVRDGRELARDVRLVSLWQGEPTPDDAGTVTREELRGTVTEATVEQDGPVRAVIRLHGRHLAAAGEGDWLPFTVRLYCYAGAEDLRLVHTVVWDGDPERDFLAGLGLRVDVPLRDEPHDRHIRLAGPAGDDGRPEFLAEAVRGITGLRRDPGPAHRQAQVQGRPCGPVGDWAATVSDRRHLIPRWSDWTLDQGSPDGYTLRKRTAPGHGWITIPGGTRAAGYGYLGGVSGGLGFGLRDFWAQYPTRLDIRRAATGTGTATVWLWSPSAPAMDLRFYHDGLGQDSHAEQLEGLEITYEDYEPGFGDPRGIARTHELVLRAYAATPPTDELAEHAAALNDPPLLVAAPDRLRAAGVFGDWSPSDRGHPARAAIEDRLDRLVTFYSGQREQRRWYGFWDYGDVMHTYDVDRHQWRYDIGGYAWDNSELSPDLWLWYQFLRTGRAEVFRFAEAMTRHTGEVDVYHQGRFAGLGSRHNVQHWGCSCKQLRISSAVYRRIYYYLTADERTGDLLDEVVAAQRTFLDLDPTRKIRKGPYAPRPDAVSVGLGTDWGALAAAWLTAWERTGDRAARDRLLGSLRDIGALRYGFLTGEALLDPRTGRLDTGREQIAVSHLSAVFGLVEICAELIALTRGTAEEPPGFERAWLQYCRLFLATEAEQRAAVGPALTGISLVQAHSRLLAYAAAATGDRELAGRAWRAFAAGTDPGESIVDGMPVLSTNDAAQYGLAAIQNLALIGDWLPAPGPPAQAPPLAPPGPEGPPAPPGQLQ